MRFTRIRASRSVTISTVIVAFAMLFSLVAGSLQRDDAAAQGVSWLGPDSVSYLTSSGIPVMVPSWLPGPVSGVDPELYAGSGSYSVYFYAGSSFLQITGVAGGGFPGGSEANLNVQLSVNANVQGWPAIQDIGIPAGTPTPIYDKVMWIADGVLYTVTGNGLDTDALTLANSSVALYAPAPAPAAPEMTAQQPSGTTTNAQNAQGQTDTPATSQETTTVPATSTDSGSGNASGESITPAATGSSSDGTNGAWFTGELNADPSDGTDGALPPFLGDDGTSGAP